MSGRIDSGQEAAEQPSAEKKRPSIRYRSPRLTKKDIHIGKEKTTSDPGGDGKGSVQAEAAALIVDFTPPV